VFVGVPVDFLVQLADIRGGKQSLDDFVVANQSGDPHQTVGPTCADALAGRPDGLHQVGFTLHVRVVQDGGLRRDVQAVADLESGRLQLVDFGFEYRN
jgi:hypothetical protein